MQPKKRRLVIAVINCYGVKENPSTDGHLHLYTNDIGLQLMKDYPDPESVILLLVPTGGATNPQLANETECGQMKNYLESRLAAGWLRGYECHIRPIGALSPRLFANRLRCALPLRPLQTVMDTHDALREYTLLQHDFIGLFVDRSDLNHSAVDVLAWCEWHRATRFHVLARHFLPGATIHESSFDGQNVNVRKREDRRAILTRLALRHRAFRALEVAMRLVFIYRAAMTT